MVHVIVVPTWTCRSSSTNPIMSVATSCIRGSGVGAAVGGTAVGGTAVGEATVGGTAVADGAAVGGTGVAVEVAAISGVEVGTDVKVGGAVAVVGGILVAVGRTCVAVAAWTGKAGAAAGAGADCPPQATAAMAIKLIPATSAGPFKKFILRIYSNFSLIRVVSLFQKLKTSGLGRGYPRQMSGSSKIMISEAHV